MRDSNYSSDCLDEFTAARLSVALNDELAGTVWVFCGFYYLNSIS